MIDKPKPRDVRMAAALTIHHRSGDAEGVAEIIRDTIETDRAAQLLESLLDIHKVYIATSRTLVGIQYLGVYVKTMTEGQTLTLDQRRAAQVLHAHGSDDVDAINRVLTDTREDKRGAHLLQAILDLYEHALPEVSSPSGRRWLDACVAALLDQEGDR